MENCRQIINSITGVYHHGMSSERSLTPSTDFDSTTEAADLAALGAHNIDEKFSEALSLNSTASMSGSEKPPYNKHVLEKECDEWAPVDYCGTMTRPLAYFGKCEVKPETAELPWISDNTSGKVHPDMRTISMLFNENLTLPKVAENFIAQSPVLQEEARWERVKAALYSFYPEDLKKQVFEVLSEMSPRKASQIIAMKTSRFENEILFISKPKSTKLDDESDSETDSETDSDSKFGADSCTNEDAIKIKKQLPTIAREHRKIVASALKRYKSLNKKLSSFSSFSGDEIEPFEDATKKSKAWVKEVEKYKEATQKCTGARFISHHLDHAVARYDPRTGWIHIKTQLLLPGSRENKSLPKDIFDFKLNSKSKIKGSTEAQNAGVDKQMELFEQELRTLSTGHLATLESYHNDSSYHEFEVRISFDRIKPSLCRAIVKKLGWDDFHIVSEPKIHRIQKSHHLLKVYLNSSKTRWRKSWYTGDGGTAESKNVYGCCLNCFSKDHERGECRQPVYAFAHPVKRRWE